MRVGDIVAIDFSGHVLHGKRVRVEAIEPEFDIAHPDCDRRMIVEMIFVSDGRTRFGISRARFGRNAGERPVEADRARGR